jgi:hypothetical protein
MAGHKKSKKNNKVKTQVIPPPQKNSNAAGITQDSVMGAGISFESRRQPFA